MSQFHNDQYYLEQDCTDHKFKKTPHLSKFARAYFVPLAILLLNSIEAFSYLHMCFVVDDCLFSMKEVGEGGDLS
jgi:hypothetical protein